MKLTICHDKQMCNEESMYVSNDWRTRFFIPGNSFVCMPFKLTPYLSNEHAVYLSNEDNAVKSYT